jgi:hypothetical protein
VAILPNSDNTSGTLKHKPPHSARMSTEMHRMSTVTLYRPVGGAELALIESSGWTAFPPRLPEQPIFYPVLEEEYAVQIARDWNTRDGGTGYVLRFRVHADFLSRFPIQTVGSRVHREYWIPSDELAEFNNHIVGPIEIVSTFRNSELLEP